MKRFFARVAAIAVALATMGQAQAAFTITLTSGANAAQVINLPQTGGITSGTYANYSYSIVATGNSPSNLNPGNLQSITTSLTALANGLPSLQIVTFSDGYSVGSPAGTSGSAVLTNDFAASALPNGTASAFSTITPGGSTSAVNVNAFAPGGGAQGGSSSATFNTTTAFSMSNTLTVSGLVLGAPVPASFTVTTTANFTPNMNAVPAPSALLLAGLGVPALGLIRRWTRKAPAEVSVA